jgi:hypothetical protein
MYVDVLIFIKGTLCLSNKYIFTSLERANMNFISLILERVRYFLPEESYAICEMHCHKSSNM